MLWRAMFLSTDSMHMSGMWPTITATLQTALLSACPGGAEQETYNNLSLLQACKLLDMFVTIQPDDFQLQEWLEEVKRVRQCFPLPAQQCHSKRLGAY